MMPLVSICIPAYNAERFIADTLQSAINQTYSNIEIIVSDDCSTDQTAQIVRRFESRGVRLIQQQNNLGMFGNFNAVIRSSKGKYILKLDADDLVDPNHLDEQVTVMEANPEVVLAHCACRLIDMNGKITGYERSIHGSFIRTGNEEWKRYVFGPKAVNIVTIRRDAFDQTGGYDEKYRYSGDWAMHRALLRLGKVYYNDNVIASYRVHSVGKQGIKALQAKEHLMQLSDIERDWPEGINGKEVHLKRARLQLGLSSARDAAFCGREERKLIIDTLPEYGDDIRIHFLGALANYGGSWLIKAYVAGKLSARQIVKGLLYSPRK